MNFKCRQYKNYILNNRYLSKMLIRAALRLHTFTILRPFADFFLGDDPGNTGVYLCNHPMRSGAGSVFTK